MSFWSSETLKKRLLSEEVVVPYSDAQVKHCAYELRMGPEAFITSSASKTKVTLEEREAVVIPPGQLAMLLTEEVVAIPSNALGFISMRFSLKSYGLINVSGFHVDPGFKGRLKFSVYNAGSRDLTVSRGDRVFMLWLSSLDQRTGDGYGGQKLGQNEVTSEDQNKMHGEIASPGQLKKEIEDIRASVANVKYLITVFVAIALGILGFEIKGCHDSEANRPAAKSPMASDQLQQGMDRRGIGDGLGIRKSSDGVRDLDAHKANAAVVGGATTTSSSIDESRSQTATEPKNPNLTPAAQPDKGLKQGNENKHAPSSGSSQK